MQPEHIDKHLVANIYEFDRDHVWQLCLLSVQFKKKDYHIKKGCSSLNRHLLWRIHELVWTVQECRCFCHSESSLVVSAPDSEMSSQNGEWKAYSALMIFENRRVSLSSKNGG